MLVARSRSSFPSLRTLTFTENLSVRGSISGQSDRTARIAQSAAIAVSMRWYDDSFNKGTFIVHSGHDDITIGYARCSTDKQDLAAQKAALEKLGVPPERIYTDHGMTGTNRARPGLDQALAAVRSGDTLVVPKLDRLGALRSRRARHRGRPHRARRQAGAGGERL